MYFCQKFEGLIEPDNCINCSMRKAVIFVVLAIFVGIVCFSSSSCTGKSTSDADTDTIMTADTGTVTDSIEEIIAETPMPKAADELFDDFFFNFAANRKLQIKRIEFPLPIVTGKKTTYLAKKNWKIDHFFMRQDFYTLIFDSPRQMDVVKDTSISHVVVERINLKRYSVKQYVFERKQGLWMMTSIRNESLAKSKNASFLHFYQKFVNDTTFQVASVNDPLEFTGPNPDDDFETMSGILAPEQWLSFAPELPHKVIYNILYGQKYTESSQKIFLIRGIANGIETELTFRRIGRKWKLMKLIM